AGSRSRGLAAKRNANVAFAQRRMVETAKTTTKREVFVTKAVQKTRTYPIDENHAQSTTTLAKRPSAKSRAITAIGTPIRRQDMLPPPSAPSGEHAEVCRRLPWRTIPLRT